MKKVFVCLSLIAFAACTAPEVMDSRVGFGGEDGSVGIGSQASVDVVVSLDAAWKNWDTEAMSEFLAADGEFSFDDGRVAEGSDVFLSIVEKQGSMDTSYSWDMFYAFSVNLENDTVGGEWVNAGFNVEGTYLDEVIEKTTFNEWYYVLDGKVTNWSSHKRKRND